MGKKVYTNSELKIIEKVYKLYIKYLKNIITEEILINKLDEVGLDDITNVKFSSKKSVFSACNRFANYYVQEILKDDKDNYYELKKNKDKLNKLDDNKDILSKIYCIYISYQNVAISEEEYTRLVEEFDLTKLNKTEYTNITTKKNNFRNYALLYAVNYLGLTEKEFDSIGNRKTNIVLELNDEEALPILEKIYNHYLDYLNVEITENELCDRAIADGIFQITEKNVLEEIDIKNIINNVVNYYFKEILGKSNKELLELKNNSLLSQNNRDIKSLSKYDYEAKTIMRTMFTLIKDYYDLRVDYDTYIEIISDTDINKVTLTKLKYNLDRKIELFKYYAKFYAINFLGIEEDSYLERLYNSDIYKKSYQYYIGLCKGKIKVSEFNTYQTTFGINALDYAKEYALRNNLMDELTKINEVKLRERFAREVKNYRNYRFIVTLDKHFLLSDFCEMVDDYNIDLVSLRKECFDYLVVTYPKIGSSEFYNKLDELRKKVDIIYEIMCKEKLLENKDVYYDSKELIEEYFTSKFSIDEFIDYKGITLQEFFNVVKELETIDKKLFNRFKEYNNIDNIDTYLLTILNINEVVKCIKFGVTIKENMRRRFELFDYFKLLSINISEYNKCLDIAFKVLDKYDYKVLETFIINHKNISLNDEENAILSMRVVEDDKIIDNNLKITIINIMKVHGVPVTRKLFNQALRKYLDGELISNKRII